MLLLIVIFWVCCFYGVVTSDWTNMLGFSFTLQIYLLVSKVGWELIVG